MAASILAPELADGTLLDTVIAERGALATIETTQRASAVLSVAFSPDGQRFLSGGQDGTVRVWPGGRAAWRHELCAKLTTNMSRQQWNDWVSPKIPYSEVCPGLPIQADG